MLKMLWNFLITAGAIYLLLCLYLFFMQDQLIFFKTKADENLYQHWKSREYTLPSNNRTLQGWFHENTHITNNTTLIYFGGNAEDVIYNLDDGNRYKINKLFFTNYAGYGESTGKPTEQSLYTDALNIYDWLMRRYQLDPDKTFIMGRSLGSAVASYVASQRKTAGTILITPFTSLADVGAEHYKLFPVRMLLKYNFNTLENLQQTKAPVLLIAAENDEIMVASHIKALHAAAQHPAEPVFIPLSGHNTLHLSPQFFDVINQFIVNTGSESSVH